MSERLVIAVGMLVNLAPFGIFCYYPFMHDLRLSRRALFLFATVFASAQLLLNIFVTPMTYDAEMIVFQASFLVCIAVYLLTVRVAFFKKLFVFLLVTNYGAGIISLLNLLQQVLHDKQGELMYDLFSSIVTVIMVVVTAPACIYILKKYTMPLLRLTDIRAWRTLWVIPLTFFLADLFIENKPETLWSWQDTAVTLTLIFGSYITHLFVLKMVYETHEAAKSREYARMLGVQLVLEEEASKKLSERIEQTRAARHDLRHHISVIDAYLQADNTAGLHEYLEEYKSTLPVGGELALCENYAVNAIAQHYAEFARAKGIEVTASISVPQEVGIAGTDLCIVFGNCLENAIEACERAKSGKKFIRIQSELRGAMLIILVDNSFDGIVQRDGEAFLSSKRNGRGIGVTSVQAVAKKYNGAAKFEPDKAVFHVSVMLQATNTDDAAKKSHIIPDG